MRLYTRLVITILTALLRRKDLEPGEESKIGLTVMPWDCVLRYVGNDRYHAFLDLARTDLAIRLGWLPSILHYKWRPQVIGCHIRHQYPLQLFDRFVISSYVIERNERYVRMAHRFECNDRVVCTAVSKLAGASRKGIANLLTLPPHSNFTNLFNRESLSLFAQADATLRNL